MTLGSLFDGSGTCPVDVRDYAGMGKRDRAVPHLCDPKELP